MVDKISNYILDNMLYRNENITGDNREVMLFGIKRIVEDIPKFLGIFIIACALHLVAQVGIVLAVTILYKTCIGGAHARTNLTCFICSSIYFLGPAIIARYITFSMAMFYITAFVVFVQSVYVIVKIAPADTEEVPIINKERRKLLRNLGGVILLLIYTFLFFVIKSIEVKQIVLITLFFINLMTTKPFYRLFKCKYSYESEELKEFFN